MPTAGTVKLWDVTEIRRLGEVGEYMQLLHLGAPNKAFCGEFCRIACSPDGKRLALACGQLAGQRAQVKVFALPHGDELLPPLVTEDEECAMGVAFSPDGKLIASASGGTTESLESTHGAVQIWDARTGEEIRRLPGHKGYGSVAFSDDGRLLASAGSDGLVKLWDARNNYKEVETLRGHTAVIESLAFRSKGKELATGDSIGVVKTWRMDPPEEFLTLRGHTAEVYRIAYHPTLDRLVSAGTDRIVRVWDTTVSQEARTLRRPHNGNVLSVAFGGKERWLVSGSHDHTVILWDLSGKDQPFTLGNLGDGVWSVAFSPAERKVAAGSGDWRKKQDGQITVWELPSGRELFSAPVHCGLARSIAFSPDGKWLASAGGETQSLGDVRIWDAASGKEKILGIPIKERKGLSQIAFSPDGRRLAGAIPNAKLVKIWDAATGEELRSLDHGEDRPWSLAFSTNHKERVLFTGGAAQKVNIWDTDTGELLAALPGHAGEIRGLAVSPNGRCVVSASQDQTLRL